VTNLVRGGALVAALAALVAGCGGTAEPPRAGQPDGGAPVRWPGPPAAERAGALPVAEFNALARAGGERWTRAAFLVATEYLRLDRADAGRTALVVRSRPEGADAATAVATLDGLLDDSVDAIRFTLELERRPDGTWALASAVREQRCRPRRGHRTFEPGACA